MIEAIVVLSLVLRWATDANIAGGLLVINAVIGYVHETKSEQLVAGRGDLYCRVHRRRSFMSAPQNSFARPHRNCISMK